MDGRACESTDGIAAQQTGKCADGEENEASGGGLTGVCHGDLGDLVRIEPYFAFPALEHTRCQPLLELQGHHGLRRRRGPPYLVCGGAEVGGRVAAAQRLIYQGVRVSLKPSQVG